MRILFVLAYHYPYIGGAEYVFLRLTEGLSMRGHSVRVITAHLPRTPYFEEINGVEIERVRVPRSGDRYLFSLLSLPNVARQARKYDLIHTASNNIAIPAYVAGKMFGKPVVFTCHEVLGERWHMVEPRLLQAWLRSSVERLIVKNPYDKYVAVSHSTYGDLIQTGIDPKRVSVVHNGVDEVFSANVSGDGKLRAMLGLNREDFLYVYFGRAGVTKGVDCLVRAVPHIQKLIPNAHLALIVSKEPFKQYSNLCRLIDQLGPDAKIHVIPPARDREQLVRYLLDADCIVVPSLTEGFGLTTAEACALGIPVVASRVGAIPEVVSGQYILVEPSCPQAICEGVVRAWRGEYDEWKPPKEFSWAKMVAGYEDVYKDLLTRCM
jgi:D-inositol-3-phosphate glycosyltransferase